MSEEMRDCKESKQSLTEVRKAERNPQKANWQLCIVHTATREKSWWLKLSPHENHVTSYQVTTEQGENKIQEWSKNTGGQTKCGSRQVTKGKSWFFVFALSFLRNTEDQTWFKVQRILFINKKRKWFTNIETATPRGIIIIIITITVAAMETIYHDHLLKRVNVKVYH